MKYSQEVSESQAVKIQLGHFLGMFHLQELRIKLLKFLQYVFMIFPMLEIGNFFGNIGLKFLVSGSFDT